LALEGSGVFQIESAGARILKTLTRFQLTQIPTVPNRLTGSLKDKKGISGSLAVEGVNTSSGAWSCATGTFLATKGNSALPIALTYQPIPSLRASLMMLLASLDAALRQPQLVDSRAPNSDALRTLLRCTALGKTSTRSGLAGSDGASNRAFGCAYLLNLTRLPVNI
jgi:hypothetical protein